MAQNPGAVVPLLLLSLTFNPKGTGEGGGGGVFHPPSGFWLITSEVESFSTRNFVTFSNTKCKIRTEIKNFRKQKS